VERGVAGELDQLALVPFGLTTATAVVVRPGLTRRLVTIVQEPRVIDEEPSRTDLDVAFACASLPVRRSAVGPVPPESIHVHDHSKDAWWPFANKGSGKSFAVDAETGAVGPHSSLGDPDAQGASAVGLAA
jgi:hypothetical protein